MASGFGPDLVVEADLGLYDYCALVPVVTVREHDRCECKYYSSNSRICRRMILFVCDTFAFCRQQVGS